VPFFLFGGRALGVNKGDELYPCGHPEALHSGSRACAISGAYEGSISLGEGPSLAVVQSRQLTKSPDNSKLWEFCALCWSAQLTGLSNDFERPVFFGVTLVSQYSRGFLRAGAAEAMLAGSGSAVLEFSRAQCWRAEPLLGFRATDLRLRDNFRERYNVW